MSGSIYNPSSPQALKNQPLTPKGFFRNSIDVLTGKQAQQDYANAFVPEVPKVPEPPAPPDYAAAANEAKRKKQQRLSTGRASTVLTGQQGLGTGPTLATKTLTGQ